MNRPIRIAAFVPLLTLAGCAGFSPDGGFGVVERSAREHLGAQVVWARSDEDRAAIDRRVAELLAEPLDVEAAVQVALLNNRSLQAGFFDLGISEADLVQAGRLPNPHFGAMQASRMVDGVREYKIEQALTFNLFALVVIPQATEIERRRFEQTQRALTLQVLRLAADTRRAWYEAVAAEQTVHYLGQAADAADAAAELARRMAAAGNWNRLQRAREHRFSAEAALSLATAKHESIAARERLVRLLGLWGQGTRFRLPERLPALPPEPEDLPGLEATAMAQRIDLRIARLEVEALANRLGLTKTTRFINVLEFGPARVLEGERGESYKTGYEIAFELPLFDWGGARVARAEAVYMQALERAAHAAVSARSEVRESYAAYRSRWDIARHHRDELVPISRRISEENLLRYNGMLIGVFELLADARSQIGSVVSAIGAQRDFWIARADLEMAVFGRPELAPASRPAAVAAAGGDKAH